MLASDNKGAQEFSIKELIEIRDRFHMHLVHTDEDNVLGTAIGRYLFPLNKQEARTIANIDVARSAEYGFPCIIVLVKQWRSEAALGARAIPKFLYLEDGRRVRTCVLSAERTDAAPPPGAPEIRNGELLGGGYPAVVEVQGEEHRGTFTCLVTDGAKTYAMTSGHVTGEPGRVVHAEIGGVAQRIGVSAGARAGKLPFARAYPGWSSELLHVNLDVGLVELDDVGRWTADVLGFGELGPVVDLEPHTLSLDLIGKELAGHGGASGAMTGRVLGFFYRYKSMGGYEYVADLLIGGIPGRPLVSQPGDSGTLLVLPAPPGGRPRPVAVQWGGDRLTAPGGREVTQLVLASCLSTVCRVLDVDFVSRRRSGQFEYWGAKSHPPVASFAVDLISSDKLRGLLEINREAIASLCQVPDSWKRMGRPEEGDAHHWNMDLDGGGEFAGSRLIDICDDLENVRPSVWMRFYKQAQQVIPSKPTTQETLPFRIGQIYDAMVEALKARKLSEFVCAAGIISHYSGDSCTPMHMSKYHDGFADRPIAAAPGGERRGSAPRGSKKPKAKGKESWQGKGIHSVVDRLLDPGTQTRKDVERAVRERFADLVVDPSVTSGASAVHRAVGMMCWAFDRVEPVKLIEAYIAAGNKMPWEQFREPVIDCVAEGVLLTADLWESAWIQGRGDELAAADLGHIDSRELERLYTDPRFLPSLSLAELVPLFG